MGVESMSIPVIMNIDVAVGDAAHSMHKRQTLLDRPYSAGLGDSKETFKQSIIKNADSTQMDVPQLFVMVKRIVPASQLLRS